VNDMNLHDLIDPVFLLGYLAQMGKEFLKYVLKLWALLVFVLALVLSALPGFGPSLWVVSASPQADRLVQILTILYTAWTFIYTGFLQREANYSVPTKNESVLVVDTNKNVLSYAAGGIVWLTFISIQAFIGQPATAFMAICAFVQLMPIFLGDSFREQAENLMPLLGNVTLLVLSLYVVGIGP
jgi:hypothetical protein